MKPPPFMRANHRRRSFLKLCGVGTAVGCIPFSIIAATESARPALRTITYNILGGKGFALPESQASLQRHQNRIPARLAMELEFYNPDIITFQEGTAEAGLKEIAGLLGFNYCFFASGSAIPGKKLAWPGAVLTRYQILESVNCPIAKDRPLELFTRHFGKARLLTEAGPLELFSAHLHPSDAAIREREVTEILRVMEPDLKRGAAVLFQGDLNHDPAGPEYQRWKEAGLVDSFAHKTRGIELTFDSHKPHKRIDFIWFGGQLASQGSACEVLNYGGFRLRAEDTLPLALSDHLPVLAAFKY